MTYVEIVRYFLLWTLFLCTISLATGSSGDRSKQFQTCLKLCLSTCNNGNSYPAKLPLYLVVFGWNCADECKYTCMHQVTQRSLARGRDIEQFYGKVRVLQAPNLP